MDLKESLDWIHVAQDRDRWKPLVAMAVNLILSVRRYLGLLCDYDSFSNRS
jgi:hypothetical protein